MSQLRTLSLLLVVLLAGCDTPNPVIVLEGGHNTNHAKYMCQSAKAWHLENARLISKVGCDKVASCRDMKAIIDTCAHDPVQDLSRFEARLATELAANPDCSSVQLMQFKSFGANSKAVPDAVPKRHWSLGLEYRPGIGKQPWWMERSADHSARIQGEGNPEEIARMVCATIKQRGA